MTVSHLRFGPEPIRSTYLIDDADFVACHQFGLLETHRRARRAPSRAPRSCSTARTGPTRCGTTCPSRCRQQIIDKGLAVWVDRRRPRRRASAGWAARINTVMQPCFFALAGVLPPTRPSAAIKASVEQTYGKRGAARSSSATSPRSTRSLAALHRGRRCPPRSTPRPQPAPRAARRRPRLRAAGHARMLAGEGDLLPVSALPVDGTFPTGTARYEKRAHRPGDPDLGPRHLHRLRQVRDRLPARRDPHEGLRAGRARPARPTAFQTKDVPLQGPRRLPPDDPGGARRLHRLRGLRRRLPGQVEDRGRAQGASTWSRPPSTATRERPAWDVLPRHPRARPRRCCRTTRSRARRRCEPLFEFSGACAGCGETPYLKLLTPALRRPHGRRQRHRLLVDLRRQPAHHAVDASNAEGRGPAWTNSLFEDNAEFGLGLRLGLEAPARRWPAGCSSSSAPRSATTSSPAILDRRPGRPRPGIRAQRERVAALRRRARGRSTATRRSTPAACWRSPTSLVRQSVWIVGGDGWAYDIGFGGLDHVLASGPQRQHPGARHRGVLQHRRPGLEGDAPRRGGQVRRRRQGDREEGPRRDRHGLRQRLRRPGRHRRQRPPDGQGAARGRGVARAVAGHRLQHVHRPRHRHDEVDEPPEGRGASRATGRSTASSPSDDEHGTRSSSTASAPSIPVADFAATEARFAMLARTDPERAERPARARAGRRRRALALLRAARGDRAHGRRRRRVPTPTPATVDRRGGRADDRPRHHATWG